ncbi:MAG: hypothetical protein O7G85_09225 [Planctomycetota bacterium]|nr:hypothetical protein [Planctomycetota bacterium]
MSQDVLDTLIGAGTSTADPQAGKTHFDKGEALEREGDRLGALEEYRKASTFDSKPDYAFRLAYLLDLLGEEDESIGIFEQLAHSDQPHINTLLNLSVLYEDRGEIAKAEKCLKQILDTEPNHERARLYMKDVIASRNMYYDEEHERSQQKHSALLDTPVTDFELSVRARNCLKKMQIRTLGDLLKITEAELLSYKNFGETSLTEIKQMLSIKGLRLGQGLDGQISNYRKEIYEELRGQAPESVLNKPISVLDLSVRARKALQLLNIQSLGDLAMRTEAELMGVKNFGQTSLEEIGEKLGDFSLGLRKLD